MMKYNQIENLTWELLINNRKKSLAKEACDTYLTGLEDLKLPSTYVPSLQEMNSLIQNFTNWRIVSTTELVTHSNYYRMLANYEFPAVLTIRPFQQINYYENKEPDVIHEYFGHGPFLIHSIFSDFMHKLAKFALTRSPTEQILLGRLFWFTIEFGLIQTTEGLKIYGAGIVPSQDETQNALHSDKVERREFNLVDVLRTPLSYSKLKFYYVIENFSTLFELNDADLSRALVNAIRLGSF